MGVAQSLAALGLEPLLRQVLAAAAQKVGGQLTEGAVDFVVHRSSEASPALAAPLQSANARAWQALEVLLAGIVYRDRLGDRPADADTARFRQLWRGYLEALPLADLVDKPEQCRQCLAELQAARQAQLLTRGSVETKSAVLQAAALLRFTDPARLLDAQMLVFKGIAAELKQAGHANLAWLVALKPEPEAPALLTAIRFFFRRELEAKPGLLPGIEYTLWQESPRREAGFAALAGLFQLDAQPVERLVKMATEAEAPAGAAGAGLDVAAELKNAEPAVQELGRTVLKLLAHYHLAERELWPSDGLSIRAEAERQPVQAVVEQFRALPPSRQEQLPALRNAIGKLQVVVGEFAAAQQDFQQAARRLAEQKAQAEVYHNAYQAGLENRNWSETLAVLKQAAELDPQRFAPFPLHKYEPERILGAGGFGVAFLCRNRHSGTRVVIKALRVDGLERQVAEVFREAQVVEELDHPAIVRLRDCDYSDAAHTKPYLVMDYFDGITLGEYVETKGPLTSADLLAIARPVADALRAAHARGLLHRDVKPANVLVRRDQTGWAVKLIDFGLALKQTIIYTTLSSSAVRRRTALGNSIAGTLDYAAPEQTGRLKGVEVGPYSDVYSFGKTCYFALLGTADPDDEEKERLPGPLRKLLSQCTARTVEKRLPDFAAVLERLAQVEAELGLGGTAARPGRAGADPTRAPTEMTMAGPLSEVVAAAKTMAGLPAEAAPPAPPPNPPPATTAAPPQGPSAEEEEIARILAEYEEAIRQNPADTDAYYNRGAAYLSLGQFERAIDDFSAVLRLEPADASAHLNRGNAHRLLGRLDQAIDDFTRAIQIDPTYVKAYLSRGDALEQLGQYERAIDDYIEAIQADPNSADGYNALTWVLATCPRDDIRDGAKALECATQACEMTGWQDPHVLDTLAAAYAELGQFAEAVKYQSQALELADAERKEEFLQRILLYKARRPYREQRR